MENTVCFFVFYCYVRPVYLNMKQNVEPEQIVTGYLCPSSTVSYYHLWFDPCL